MRKSEFSLIAPDVRIGEDVRLGSFVQLSGCEISAGCEIGSYTVIQPGARIGWGVHVGNHVLIGAGVVIEKEAFIGDGARLVNDRYPDSLHGNVRVIDTGKVIRVGQRAFVGANVTVLGQVCIGEGAVVNAGSLVSEDVPRCTFVSGVPAKYVRPIPEPLDSYRPRA